MTLAFPEFLYLHFNLISSTANQLASPAPPFFFYENCVAITDGKTLNHELALLAPLFYEKYLAIIDDSLRHQPAGLPVREEICGRHRWQPLTQPAGTASTSFHK